MYLRFLNAMGLTGFVRLEQLILFDMMIIFTFDYCNHFIDAALCFLLDNVLAVYLVI